MTGQVEIRRAAPHDLELLVPLFDAYRQFYQQPSDPELAGEFLARRLSRGESIVFLAIDGGRNPPRTLGFTQLYPSYCSVLAAPILILYDLFVTPEGRRGGIGRLLMDRARRHAVETGARRIELSTAHTNQPAQALYESLGYRRDETYRVYQLLL